MKQRLSFPEKILQKDIKYRGFLSYRGLRILGWIGMAVIVVGTTLGFGASIVNLFGHTGTAESFRHASEIMGYFSILPIPLFLFANFGIIINGRDNYKRLIIQFAALAGVIYFIFLFAYLRYGLMIANKLLAGSQTLSPYEYFELLAKNSLADKLYFNVFIDMTCCVLVSYFMNYMPKKSFKGKKIYLFRALSLLPIAYVFLSFYLRSFNGEHFHLPVFVAPLLSCKPPLMILMFVVISLVMKLREKHVLKKTSLTKEQYHHYLKNTNGSSLAFSITAAIGLTSVVILDLAFVLITLYSTYGAMANNAAIAVAIGYSLVLVIGVPILFLYSFNKKVVPSTTIDLLIPIGGIAIMAFAFLETAFQIFMVI